jgi:hypothetical protein
MIPSLYTSALTRDSGVFESVIVITFQNVFHSKIHQNNIFYFFKIIFDINTLKWSKNTKKYKF